MKRLDKKILFFLVFIVVFCIGFSLRYFFDQHTDYRGWFDQESYIKLSHAFEIGQWAINCCSQSYGYPLFLFLIRLISGQYYFDFAVRYSQILLDMVTATILLAVTVKLTKSHITGMMVFLLYSINPFTAPYVGYYLTEIVALFFLVIAFGLLINLSESASSKFGRWSLFGMAIGAFTFTRIGFFPFAILVMIVVPLGIAQYHKQKPYALIAIFAGFILTCLYPTLGNFFTYGVITPNPVTAFSATNFYHSTLFPYYPQLVSDKFYNDERSRITARNFEKIFSAAPTGKRNQVVQEFVAMTIDFIKKNPQEYALQRIRNIGYIWRKSHLYYYVDPWFPQDSPWVFYANIMLLTGSILGLLRLKNVVPNSSHRIAIRLFIGSMIFFFTVPMAFFTAEERITLPYYPFAIILFMLFVTSFTKKKIHNNN